MPWLLSRICFRNILDVLQGVKDGPKFRVQDWYRPHLGEFICVNKDGVLCHTEGDAENGTRSSSVPMESLTYNDLMGETGGAGILWPNPAQTPNSGHHMSQTPNGTDELVLSLFPHVAILSGYLRNWHLAFYNDFLNQISNLAGRSPT